jgi:hypothetical protein
MKKFENVDVIETLRKIMLHNTHHYQTDFGYDIQMLKIAALPYRSGDTFLWMSRHNGTWLFPERDVHIFQTDAHTTWQGYIPDYDGVKAFWIELTETKESAVMGNICELDYKNHINNLRKNSVAANEILVAFRNPPGARSFEISEFFGNRNSIQNRYGEMGHIEYQVKNEQELRSNLKNLARDFWQAAEPADIDEYIKNMADERFKSIGYTSKDMAYLSERDAFFALKRNIPVWLLSENNGREEIKTADDIQHHISRDGVFGIEKEHRHLLDYLKTHPGIEDGLFNHEELRKIMFLSIMAGKDKNTSPNDLRTLKSILYKLDKACFSPAQEYENEQNHTLVSDMVNTAAEDEFEP